VWYGSISYSSKVVHRIKSGTRTFCGIEAPVEVPAEKFVPEVCCKRCGLPPDDEEVYDYDDHHHY
jgi:hypothetical protein